MTVIRLSQSADLIQCAAEWFSQKWSFDIEVYLNSMRACVSAPRGVPQWYIAKDGEKIVCGLGVVENDFHERKDLSPNICAVYVEEEFRGRGLAGRLLNVACADLAAFGYNKVYLATDHTGFYERYGFEYLCGVKCDFQDNLSRLYSRTLK